MAPLVAALILGALGTTAQAGPFTQGNLVVLRVNGTTLTSAAAAAFLDEYTTGGTLVQSIPMSLPPTGPNLQFTCSGTSGNDGQLARSQDRQYITTLGYTSPIATAAVASTTTPRVVARIDKLGNIDTTTGLGTNFSATSPRWAASTDGTSFWTGGGNTGVVYATLGGGTVNVITNSTLINGTPAVLTNTRSGQVVGGTLYIGHGSGTNTRIVQLPGNPPPTSGTNLSLIQMANIPGANSGLTGFAMLTVNSGVSTVIDTIYAGDTAAATSTSIVKWCWDGTNWINKGSIGTVGAVQVYGVVAIKTPGAQNVDVYFTGGSSAGNTIQHLQDTSGFNGTFNGTAAVIATATNDTVTVPNNINAFRGLTVTPDTATLVDVTSFNVKANGADVSITWSSRSEKDAVGFNVWRADTLNGQYIKINPNLIPAVGGLFTAANYSYHDLVTPSQTYFYKLEDIDTAGVSTYQVPIEVKATQVFTPNPVTNPGRPTTPRISRATMTF